MIVFNSVYNHVRSVSNFIEFKNKCLNIIKQKQWYKLSIEHPAGKIASIRVPFSDNKWIVDLGPDNIKGHRWRFGYTNTWLNAIDIYFENKDDALKFKLVLKWTT